MADNSSPKSNSGRDRFETVESNTATEATRTHTVTFQPQTEDNGAVQTKLPDAFPVTKKMSSTAVMESVWDDNAAGGSGGDMFSTIALAKGSTGDFVVAASPSESAMIGKSTTDKFLEDQRANLPSMAEQCRFEWHHLNVFVGEKEKRKQILFDFNGEMQSGELLAVMGGSGAGKSTLLNALSGRTNLNQQHIEGWFGINGKKFKIKKQQIIRSVCTFVPQTDILCATQTVEEALLFYARLKLPSTPLEEQRKRVEYLINVLHLDRCRNNPIGDEKRRGISGGEKRRVSIAAEILNDVDIIFLDEPTSGLDAYTAARTIKTLKEFCVHSNKIIIATIHQPSVEGFHLFDKLILLGAGQCCFNSEVRDVAGYFADQLRPRANPADILLFEVQRSTERYADKWAASALNPLSAAEEALRNDAKWAQHYDKITLDMVKRNAVEIRNNTDTASRALQLQLLIVREVRGLWRDRGLTVMRLVQVVFFAGTTGFLYLDVGQRVGQKISCFFFIGLTAMLFGLVTTVGVFPIKKLLWQREHNAGSYDTSAWAVSVMSLELPREAAHMLLFTVIVYFMCGLDSDFVTLTLLIFLCDMAGASCGILCGTLSRNETESALSVPGVCHVCIKCSKFFLGFCTPVTL